ncbi:maleate isomerase [Cribrihabitans marinus]|uniref:Maleate isomerase n=1 Tax=Cribrihabitans marinus TaxID=1227549 RepID=A0A1H6Z907_9RHOB|nr:aspartate/glutamate racemase family protein [Cribrihabitans marinus]GGH31115.1 Asp/Glu racemase [Cribrihabitans marinus]SEJ49909.1 maleate isomerase [Cribrihabitans marinus]
MARFPYRLTGPIGSRATLGLVVLRVDETIEQDFRRLFTGGDVALHVTRIPSGDDLTPDTIATMEGALPRAVSLLPPAAAFDVVGYGCTSGTTLIGAERVAQLVRGSARTRAVSDPLTAALAAIAAMRLRSVAIVSPYIETVNRPIRAALEGAGLNVPETVSFGEEVEARVARIDPASIRDAALSVGRAPGAEAVFLSCTNLRTLDIIEGLEAELGKPVLSSNQALAWHMGQLAGGLLPTGAPGRLFRL